MARHKVLITVTTYPLPSRSYDELVCTAGVLDNGSWIRIYPVPLQFLKGLRKDGKIESFKYNWIELDLNRRSDDFRPESHSPANYSFADMVIHGKVGTERNWEKRKAFCTKNVYTSRAALIADSQSPKNVSLATFKPTSIIAFEIEDDEREWKSEWKDQLAQLPIGFDGEDSTGPREQIRKLPYKFYYRFQDSNGEVSRLMIEDWEIGALYWNCLRAAEGDETFALEKVREKYEGTFLKEHDILFFLGTTKEWHTRRARNPFVIIGVFYPKRELQTRLF